MLELCRRDSSSLLGWRLEFFRTQSGLDANTAANFLVFG